MKKINVGLIGCGTVGTGVAKILIENKELITSRVGAILNLKSVADIDITSDRGLQFDNGVMTTDSDKVVTDPDIDIISRFRPTIRRNIRKSFNEEIRVEDKS